MRSLDRRISSRIQESYKVGDCVYAVVPTEMSYRWIIDGPLTIKEVVVKPEGDNIRILYQFVEFIDEDMYDGYTTDVVFSTFQDAVQFRIEMIKKFRYRCPELVYELMRNSKKKSS